MSNDECVRLHQSTFIVNLPLSLFMFLRAANHQNFSVPANDFAIITTLLDGGAYFHGLSLT
jgi:hypothetical protein